MAVIIHLLVGFAMSFVGLLPPGMLNMTSVRQSIEEGLRSATQFSAGAGLTVGIQAFVALYFARLLSTRPQILQGLEYVAIPIFFVLAIYFYFQGKKEIKKAKSTSQKGPLVSGFLMAYLNTIAVPYFFGYCTLMEYKGWISLDMPMPIFIALGAALGAFALFALYGRFAQLISSRIGFVARNINYILSGLFVVLAMVTIYRNLENIL